MYLTLFHQLRSGLGSSASRRPAPHRSAIARSYGAPCSALRFPVAYICCGTKFHQLTSGLGSSGPHRPAPHRSVIARSSAGPCSALRCPVVYYPPFISCLTNFHQLRSGLGSSAPHRPAPHRSAIARCNAALMCFAALRCCVLCGSLYMPVTFAVSSHVPVLLLISLYQYILRCWITMHPQLRSARLYIALSSAARHGAVPCVALRFAVLRRAALCVLLNIQQ